MTYLVQMNTILLKDEHPFSSPTQQKTQALFVTTVIHILLFF